MRASLAPRPSGALLSSEDSFSALFHQLNNRLGVILGFCELLLLDMPATDPRCGDVLGIKKAADSAAALLLSHDPETHDVSPSGDQRASGRTEMTAGFQRTGGRKAAGVA